MLDLNARARTWSQHALRCVRLRLQHRLITGRSGAAGPCRGCSQLPISPLSRPCYCSIYCCHPSTSFCSEQMPGVRTAAAILTEHLISLSREAAGCLVWQAPSAHLTAAALQMLAWNSHPGCALPPADCVGSVGHCTTAKHSKLTCSVVVVIRCTCRQHGWFVCDRSAPLHIRTRVPLMVLCCQGSTTVMGSCAPC